MSFSEEVKHEVAHCAVENDIDRQVELAAILSCGGTVFYTEHDRRGFEFSTIHSAVARKVLQMWNHCFSLHPEVSVRQGVRLHKRNYYVLHIPPAISGTTALKQLHLLHDEPDFSTILVQPKQIQRIFLRGAFMGSGSVNPPQRDYHLEIITLYASVAKVILKIMRRLRLMASMTERKGMHVIYIKEGNSVAEFLQQIGAAQAYLQFESVRVMKDMRNNVNRIVNCETANLQKTVDAAIRQRHCIEVLKKNGAYIRLSEKLKEAATLRLLYPEAPLSELAAHSEITKSGLSHRLKKIEKLAQAIEGNDI
ncbi:DNA-binding protein WhiA [Megasphaera sp. UPII 135-E]|uniref:DNA-binding protein WhiA n=1 Tax=Megasphaera sp. UPII 135-E TaxID=1000569 RepID=UPI00021A1B99|nr:DNA-binding protein WhiA [Megasphaera sp. UPII 135-E]EGS34030.1 hypothetical protein HMPREF1040_1554 [Megasphaera sp. UPII 135-E]MUP59663.1 DNA-binding protein WhiA [Veillonellaceae bacterium M2-4]